MTVRADGGKLLLSYGGESDGELEHWHYDTFRATYQDKAIEPQLITFELDAAGKVAALELPELGRFKREAEKSDKGK